MKKLILAQRNQDTQGGGNTADKAGAGHGKSEDAKAAHFGKAQGIVHKTDQVSKEWDELITEAGALGVLTSDEVKAYKDKLATAKAIFDEAKENILAAKKKAGVA